MKTEPYVSILTPVFNGEKYLDECIQSVLSQTYENWEYVIVNNKSTDGTADIIRKYADSEPRIRVYENDSHLPVMHNLNNAFRQISPVSKYCKVIHADDWMFPECVSRMVEIAERYPTVGIVNSYRLVSGKIGPTGLPYPSHYISGREISRKFLLEDSSFFSAPSNLLIRSDLIRKRDEVYDPSYLQSDLSACLDMLSESDFGFVHQVLTFTRRHDETVTETMAKKYSSFMLGNLKILKDYGPIYLTEEEMEKALSRKIGAFYSQFAKNIYSQGFSDVFVRHKKELESINMPLKRVRLLFYLIRESFASFLKIFDFEVVRSH